MRALRVLGLIVIALIVGAGAYAYFGYYDIAATNSHADFVHWSLETVQDNAVKRRAEQEVGQAPPLDSPDMIRMGGRHYQEEGCLSCHGGPGITQAEFAEYMRPRPPDLTKVAATWNDSEFFWIMQHGIKMTGMPAFGPSHSEEELWAMVAFVRQLPGMSESRYKEFSGAAEGEEGHHTREDAHVGESKLDEEEHSAP
jgi:mono/diheme cytochrome c family protein